MSIVSLLAAVAVIALIAWAIGSGLARFAGALLALYALIQLATIDEHQATAASAFGLLTLGVGLWLLGHWIFALKHQGWRSRLAYAAFSLPVLRLLAPIPTKPRRARRTWTQQAAPVAWAPHPHNQPAPINWHQQPAPQSPPTGSTYSRW